MCITYSECVFVALGKMRMRFIITCGLSGYAIFFHITSQTAQTTQDMCFYLLYTFCVK